MQTTAHLAARVASKPVTRGSRHHRSSSTQKCIDEDDCDALIADSELSTVACLTVTCRPGRGPTGSRLPTGTDNGTVLSHGRPGEAHPVRATHQSPAARAPMRKRPPAGSPLASRDSRLAFPNPGRAPAPLPRSRTSRQARTCQPSTSGSRMPRDRSHERDDTVAVDNDRHAARNRDTATP